MKYDGAGCWDRYQELDVSMWFSYRSRRCYLSYYLMYQHDLSNFESSREQAPGIDYVWPRNKQLQNMLTVPMKYSKPGIITYCNADLTLECL